MTLRDWWLMNDSVNHYSDISLHVCNDDEVPLSYREFCSGITTLAAFEEYSECRVLCFRYDRVSEVWHVVLAK